MTSSASAAPQLVAKPNGGIDLDAESESTTLQPQGEQSWWSFFPSLQAAAPASAAGSSTEAGEGEGEDMGKSDLDDQSDKSHGGYLNSPLAGAVFQSPSTASRASSTEPVTGALPGQVVEENTQQTTPQNQQQHQQDGQEQQQQQQHQQQPVELAQQQQQQQQQEEATASPDEVSFVSAGAAVCSVVGTSVAWTLFGGPVGGIIGFVSSTVAVASMGMTNTTATAAVIPLAILGPVPAAVGAASAVVVVGANSAATVTNYIYGQDMTEETSQPTDDSKASEGENVPTSASTEAEVDPTSTALVAEATAKTSVDESAEVVVLSVRDAAEGEAELPGAGSERIHQGETVALPDQRSKFFPYSLWPKLQKITWPPSCCSSTPSTSSSAASSTATAGTPSCFCMPMSFPKRPGRKQRSGKHPAVPMLEEATPSRRKDGRSEADANEAGVSLAAETGAEVLSRHIKEAQWSAPSILLYETTSPNAAKQRLISPTSSTSASSGSTAASASASAPSHGRFGSAARDCELDSLARTDSTVASAASTPPPRVPAKLIELNGTGEGALIDNDFFQGTAVMMYRPPNEDVPCLYRDYFATRGRCWELRVQGRFKVEKIGRLFAGVELPDFDYSEHVGVWSSWLARTCQVALQKHLGGGDLRLSFGSRGAESQSSEAEIGEIIGGLAVFDRIVESTGTPPPIGGDLEGEGILRSQAKNWLEATSDIERRLNTSTTYTFCFWGASRFVDLVDERLKNLGPLNCCLRSTVLGGWPPHIVLYAVDDVCEEEKEDDDCWKPMPRQPRPSEKRYMMDLMICNDRTCEMPEVCEKYDFQDRVKPIETISKA